jgi:IS5 family transposase
MREWGDKEGKMNKQPSFSASEYAGKMKEKATCRERFLVEMENVVPWKELEGLIEPFYPKGE